MNLFEMLPLLSGWRYYAEVFNYRDTGWVGKTVYKKEQEEFNSEKAKGWLLGGTVSVSDEYLEFILEVDDNSVEISPYALQFSTGANPNNFTAWLAFYEKAYPLPSGDTSPFYTIVYSPGYPMPFNKKWRISARLRTESSSDSATVYGYALAMIIIEDEDEFYRSVRDVYRKLGVGVII